MRKFLGLIIVMLLTGCTANMKALQEGKTSFAEQDYGTAYQKLLPLAKDGNADAQYAVGYMYYYGKGVKENQGKAEEWIRKAANQGQLQAAQVVTMLEKRKALVSLPKRDPIDTLN